MMNSTLPMDKTPEVAERQTVAVSMWNEKSA